MKKFNVIARYLSSTMTVEERTQFESELKQNPALQADFDFAKEVIVAIKDTDNRNFRNAIGSIINEKSEQHTILRIINRPLYKWVAGVILLISISFFISWHFLTPRNSYDRLFAQYYQTYPLDFMNRSDGNVLSNLYMAFTAYQERNYTESLTLFNKVIETDSTLVVAYFYRGISCIETNNLPLAITSFNKVLHFEQNSYAPQSHWYSALTYVRLKDKDNAMAHLKWLKTCSAMRRTDSSLSSSMRRA